jgi:hypothetical protein
LRCAADERDPTAGRSQTSAPGMRVFPTKSCQKKLNYKEP